MRIITVINSFLVITIQSLYIIFTFMMVVLLVVVLVANAYSLHFDGGGFVACCGGRGSQCIFSSL